MDCTARGCPCWNMERRSSEISFTNITGERPCNTCFSANTVFVSIAFNLVRHCEYKEIIICENGIEVGERYDGENKVCRYDPYILIFNLRYIGVYWGRLTHNQPAMQVNGTSFPGGE